jgi:ArsR family transcriptional regulator
MRKTGFGQIKKESASREMDAQHALYAMQAEICRVLGHPKRLEILDLLAGGERPSSELLRALGVTKANLSQHLSLMRHANLVESRQRGREVFHRLAFGEIKNACQMIRGVLAARLEQGSRLAKALYSAAKQTAQPSGPPQENS